MQIHSLNILKKSLKLLVSGERQIYRSCFSIIIYLWQMQIFKAFLFHLNKLN